MPAPPCRARPSPLRRRSRHSACPLTADRAARRPEQRAWPRRLASLRAQVCRARRSPLRRRSRPSACSPTADRPTHQPGQRRTRPANLFTAATYPRRGATFPRLSGATSGNATVDAAVIAIRSPGGAAPLPICCRSTTCCQSPRAVARSRPTWFCVALLITECATATDRLLRRSLRCSASSALLARHSTALAGSLQVARRGYPGRSLSMRSRAPLSWSPVNDFLPLPAFAPVRTRPLGAFAFGGSGGNRRQNERRLTPRGRSYHMARMHPRPLCRYAFRSSVCILLPVNVFARPAQRAPELIYHNFI